MPAGCLSASVSTSEKWLHSPTLGISEFGGATEEVTPTISGLLLSSPESTVRNLNREQDRESECSCWAQRTGRELGPAARGGDARGRSAPESRTGGSGGGPHLQTRTSRGVNGSRWQLVAIQHLLWVRVLRAALMLMHFILENNQEGLGFTARGPRHREG